MGLSCKLHRFRAYTAIPDDNLKFFSPRVFYAPADGVPLGIGFQRKGQNPE